MTMTSRQRNGLVSCLVAALLTVAPAQTQTGIAPVRDLAGLFAEGPLLVDENDDDVLDAINAQFVLAATATAEDVSAAANIAARLGFESSAFTPGLAVTDLAGRATGNRPQILVGRTNARVKSLANHERVALDRLKPGQGVIALVPTQDGAMTLVIAGGDETGTAVAGAAASARLPYLWQLRGDSIHTVREDLRAFLTRAGARVERVEAVRAVYEHGKERTVALTFEVGVASSAEVAVKALEALARAHTVGHAEFGHREADTLNYYGLDTLEVRLDGRSVRIDRFGPPYQSKYPANPWVAKPKSLSLASIFTKDGLLGDSRGNDMIPDETETRLVIGKDAGSAIAAVDLAARIGIEGTGITLPLAYVESEIGNPADLANPILIGTGSLAASLPLGSTLEPGQGEVRVVSGAFGEFSAVVVRGGDAAGLNAAVSHFARSVPFVWTPRRGEASLSDVEEDVRAFFRARSSAGQAAAALEALDAALPTLPQDLASVDAKLYLEQESAETARSLESALKARLPRAAVTASAASRYGPVTIFEDEPELGWEVDELRARFTTEVLPRIARGQPVAIDVLVSEGPALRRDLEQEFRQAALGAGASEARIRVISAYKQGYSWLADYVLPAVKGKDVGAIVVYFPEAKPPVPAEKWYGMSIRWLQETFPIDEIAARELNIDVDATTFTKVDDGPIEYRVEVKDRNGRPLLTDTFAPRITIREYFPQKPAAKIHYTTGGVSATSGNRKIADFNVRTDPERFWDYYQTKVFPRMVDHVRQYTGGRMVPENQPYFRDLIFDISMSEPDFRLGLQEERISSLDSLHEDLMFTTIDFWSILSGNKPGSRDVAPGRIMPMIHPVEHGKAPRVKFAFNGNAVPRPRLVLSWKTKTGRNGSRTLDLGEAAVNAPRVTGVSVRSGAASVAAVAVTVGAETFDAAQAATRRVNHLAGLQKAGAFPNALAYPQLESVTIIVRQGMASLAQSIAPPGAGSPPHTVLTIKPEPGKRIVSWDHVVTPQEVEEEIIPRLRTFPEINAYVAGETYRGRNVWAMDVMLPIKSEIWSQAKASALKPVLFLTTRVHANEVSAMSAGLRLMELLATDPEYRKYLKRMNIVYRPIENVDGAANHAEFLKLQPTYILHAGYWSAVARDVSAYLWDEDPLLPEARVRRELYYTWLPDIFMDPHGYPSHEWVHQFAGYKVPWFMAFWIPRGYHINLHHLDDANFPNHKAVGLELRERIIEEVMDGVPGFKTTNLRLVHRYEKYARRYEPDPFRLEIYKGMNILFDHSYSYDVDGPFSEEVYVSAIGRRRNPEGRSFLQRHPEITVLDLGCDMPDETASGEWMQNFAAPGQLGYQRANLKLLYESEWSVQRFEEDFKKTVRLSVFRPRPVKASRPPAARPTTSP